MHVYDVIAATSTFETHIGLLPCDIGPCVYEAQSIFVAILGVTGKNADSKARRFRRYAQPDQDCPSRVCFK